MEENNEKLEIVEVKDQEVQATAPETPKKPRHKGLIVALIVVLALFGVYYIVSSNRHEIKEKLVHSLVYVEYPGEEVNYSSEFDATDRAMLKAAKSAGLESIPKTRDAIDLSQLDEIKTCAMYKVDKLTTSVPYLTPKAKQELDRIGILFVNALKDRDLPSYRFFVTSALRTKEDIQDPANKKSKSSEKDVYGYGNTWDITYTRFSFDGKTNERMKPEELKKLLGSVLLEEQRAGRLMVKYDKNQACFHLTAR